MPGDVSGVEVREELKRAGHLNDIPIHNSNVWFRYPQVGPDGIECTGEMRGDEFSGDNEGALAALMDKIIQVVLLENDDSVDGL